MANFIGSIVVVLFFVVCTKACTGLIAGPDPEEQETVVADK